MAPLLYINTRGEAHTKHSYSAGLDFDQSAYKYYLRRVMGWREKDDRASFKFGRAIEKAIEFYHDNNGRGIIERFTELWAPAKEENLVYTKREVDWASLNRAGMDMVRLYAIRRPSLPIPLGAGSVFQREYGKEVFPGDENYGEIVDAGKLDIVAYVDPSHPMLPAIEWKPEYGVLRPLIVDMKTSAVDLPESQGIVAFDAQLRRYSWQSGIRDVSLLWFVKKSHSYKKGSRITLFVDAGDFKAGAEVYVADVSKTDPAGAYIVGSEEMIMEMERVQGRKENGDLETTKVAKERKATWLFENSSFVRETDFTRQRLQFNAGRVSDESANDAGLVAGRQIVQIVNSWKNKQWPNTFGIRFPRDDSNDPYFRAFVLNDTAFKEEHFTLNSSAESDLFDEDLESEEIHEN